MPKLLERCAAKSVSPEVTFALTELPDAAALDGYLDGIGGRANSLRDPSRRAIEAIRGQTLAIMEELRRAQPFTGEALAQLPRAFGKDDRALQGPLCEGNSKPVAPDAEAKFAARHAGDPAEGRKRFEDAATCTACPGVNRVGGQIGPDLTTITTKCDRAFMVDAVLYPSKQILDADQTTTVTLKNGQTSAGFLRGQTATETLLVDVGGANRIRCRATRLRN